MSRNGVTIPKHWYSRDEQSGAGNCWCGRAERSWLHPEHVPVPSYKEPAYCTCGHLMVEHPVAPVEEPK